MRGTLPRTPVRSVSSLYYYKLSFCITYMKTLSMQGSGWMAAVVAALSVFAIVSVVQAATTISTDISTGGTLAVTGASTLSSTLDVTGLSTLTGGVKVGSSGSS